MKNDRRSFVLGTGASVLLLGCTNTRDTHASSPPSTAASEAEVSPPEDLMREHGVLNRILLVYEEGVRRIAAQQDAPADVLATSAKIIQSFIEQYHERLEEDFLFPQFERKNTLVALVGTLRRQHQAGRALTEEIVRLASTGAVEADSKRKLSVAMQAFIRMYRPHEAREDTILFPELRKITSAEELGELGDQFEQKEHALFGKEGFEGIVAQVARLEQRLGIYDLNLFTPEGT